ncbi:hypothetical protein [Natronorubrum daqingense]|uniref:DUF8115 domain-containing protein n=1 Tax=Natronorubrum daqingense TaxID=588898 RepID=A0A1N7G191_9EURY|nr:hypothetical protein [Natronorubrum daqingense]APX98628.1 hypothetical protein BB347_18215 [Natronorubrum daqingense]SIS06373.1 hypothetical protein SAMN05421809_3659 [Natronorubrum daqingense]
MSENSNVSVDELVEQHKEETSEGRSGAEAAVEQDTQDTPELEAAVADAYQQIDDGELSSNLTLRDENLAALFTGLENSQQLEAVENDAASILGRDGRSDTNRAAVLRKLVRIGLSEVDQSLIESGKEGRRQFLESQTDEF